ncbi:hypothetical protein [Aequorivita marina]|uniref:hypothetical protein n=1 Tax=Aequorivita marina TaxID=3073654 RepID=UPI0028744C95|nr:hypothetical protein [Aequorivita sp. S2608]MDS1296849.1 hypothetical protein [Aequorivita sp. S2608]
MRFSRNLLLLLLPYLLMIVINEAYRPTIKEKPYSANGVTAINSDIRMPDKCSWAAHNDTSYCKEHHVKFLKNYFFITDLMYFGVITALRVTGNYGAANIIFLVILFPLFIWYSLVKVIDYSIEIRNLKKQTYGRS